MPLAHQTLKGTLFGMNANRRLSPLQSVTYGSKDAPQLRSTGRSNGTAQNPPPSLVAQINRQEIARETAEKGFNFAPAKELSKRQLKKKRKSIFLPPINHEIKHPVITFIDIEGKVHEDQPLTTVLEDFSGQKYTLVLVDPTTKTARLFTNQEYKRHVDELKSRHKSGVAPSKEIQVTWNVGDNDLVTRLNRAITHLQRGGRLSIILGARKVKLVRTRQQRDELLKRIRDILAPYAVEWREMTGGFPNAELSFQGIQSKSEAPGKETGMIEEHMEEEEDDDDDNDEEQVKEQVEEEDEDKDENEGESEGGEAKLNPDDQSIPWEQLQEIRAKFKGRVNRQAARESADKAFEQTTGTSKESISETYWKQLAIPTAETSTGASSNQKAKKKQPVQRETDPEAIKAAEKARDDKAAEQERLVKAAAEARLAELSGKVLPERQGEAQEAREKLRSVVTQFSKLGATKSLFGSKIGRR